MRWSILVVSLTANFLFAGDRFQSENIPQAQSVIRWLKAVKEGDQKLLKNVFSEKLRERFDEEGWDKVLKTYQKAFEKEFGDYRLEDFAFEFDGGEQKGKVLIFHKGKKLPGVQVIKEQNDWKVNER